MAERITSHAPDDYEVTVHAPNLSEEEQIASLQNADFLILFGTPPVDAALKAATNLKLIQLVSAGYDQLNVTLCQELGIPIANNGGANSIDVAEHTLALILGFYRHMVAQDGHVRNNQYKNVNNGLDTFTIHGKTVGLIGLGNIGQRLAKLLNALGANIIYTDAQQASPEIEQEHHATYTDLNGLLQQSDIVSLHVPLLDSTRNLIGAEQLAQMKSNALLVNTCRGGVVDQPALTKALQAKSILGAALDVLASEPPDPSDPILKCENVLLTPHSAGVTFDTWSRRGEFVFANLQRVWQGESPKAVVG
ncbi:MAG: lactate dehydrogenase [Candidatus Latescibacteria bacterium]|nr:lactate dehydrogenase [Candidatus Latescibacterota bacterium]MBT4138883.1 lactate dehydrogenase [Candidatus Latescibacterota bacterium]